MTKNEYRKYLKSKHWIEIRRERKRIDGNSCYLCGKRKQLNVHHLNYNSVGNEDVQKDLVTLCKECHRMLHRVKDASKFAHDEFLRNHDEQSLHYLGNRIKEKVIEQLWLRDINFGGDLKVFGKNTKVLNRLLKMLKIIYPDIQELDVENDIRREVRKITF